MGKNKDRVAELEAKLSAATMLCRSTGELIGVPITEEITVSNIHRYVGLFSTAINARGRRTARSTDGLGGGRLETFDDDVNDEIDRMEAQGLTRRTEVATGKDSLALSADASPPLQDQPHHSGAMTLIERRLGISLSGLPIDVALMEIYREIEGIQDSGDTGGDEDTLSKGDTLAQQMDHYKSSASHLHTQTSGLRLILGRVAGALQVSQWDADGTEIIERAQRFDGLKHELKRRIDALVNYKIPISSEADARACAIDELRYVLMRLVSKADVARWASGKAGAVASAAAVEIAEAPPEIAQHLMFTQHTVTTLCCIMDSYYKRLVEDPTPDVDVINAVFRGIGESSVTRQEIMSMMNLIIIPILVRQGLLTAPNKE